MFDRIGRWWGTNPVTRAQEEIDLVAGSKSRLFLGECKWTNTKVGLEILNNLERKAALFPQYGQKYYGLFSKNGFSDILQSQADKDIVELIGLSTIYL
jgi:hypothetical protein